ncbi:MAG TPA: hypothetical protein VMU26_07695, partial [Candidatus Polarisedimenticolia bacterium]|nr:hypothetical protein [Candidatus Polarisedimenticolia bacterium]
SARKNIRGPQSHQTESAASGKNPAATAAIIACQSQLSQKAHLPSLGIELPSATPDYHSCLAENEVLWAPF